MLEDQLRVLQGSLKAITSREANSNHVFDSAVDPSSNDSQIIRDCLEFVRSRLDGFKELDNSASELINTVGYPPLPAVFRNSLPELDYTRD